VNSLSNEYCVAIGNEAIYTKTFRDAAQAYQSGHSPIDQLEQEFAAEVPEVWRGYVAAGDPGMLDWFTERCVERVVGTLEGMLNEWNAEPKEVGA
jgi:hypothetical protein